jgi:ABC-type antimicrobial peptide transport system ATPase subunit
MTATVRRFAMNPWQASARFAAFVWYLNRDRSTLPDEAARLAKDNWIAFLPYADERIGRLLVTDHPRAKAVREKRWQGHGWERKKAIALAN